MAAGQHIRQTANTAKHRDLLRRKNSQQLNPQMLSISMGIKLMDCIEVHRSESTLMGKTNQTQVAG